MSLCRIQHRSYVRYFSFLSIFVLDLLGLDVLDLLLFDPLDFFLINDLYFPFI